MGLGLWVLVHSLKPIPFCRRIIPDFIGKISKHLQKQGLGKPFLILGSTMRTFPYSKHRAYCVFVPVRLAPFPKKNICK